MVSNTSGCAPARKVSSRPALVGPSRKRTSGDGLALEIRPLQPAQPVRSAQTTARGRRMPGTRGTLPGYASESSRQQRVPYREAERRILGAAFWIETRTPHERLGRMHDDLLAPNKET